MELVSVLKKMVISQDEKVDIIPRAVKYLQEVHVGEILMRLKEVIIQGFRSIEKMRFPLEGNGHKILVGKNESGKSNILKALSLLSHGKSFKSEDKKEGYEKEAYVQFVFSLERENLDNFKKEFHQILGKNNIIVENLLEEISQDMIYEVKCGEEKKWVFSEFPKDLQNKFLPPEILTDLRKNLNSVMKKVILKSENDKLFPVIDWKYSTEIYDVPSSVNMNEFANKPDICTPLKNMFLLSDFKQEEIGKEIHSQVERGSNSFRNLLNKVSDKVNDYIGKNWEDFQNIELQLNPNGENIDIGIRDKDSKTLFDFKQRSDGFRRLFSFLLLMSGEVRKKNKKQKLILLDMPELGLHHKSAKDLRNKIIKLGQNHLVVYSTYSISMIDLENMENNFIISRRKENTTLKQVKQEEMSAEDIYQAIGYLDEELGQKKSFWKFGA